MQVIEEEAKEGSIVEGEYKEQESRCENQKVISQIQADVHHRALRKKLISKFGRISPKTSLATLREFY